MSGPAASSSTSTTTHHDTVRRFFALIGAADYNGFFELWSDDPTFDMPYRAPGMAERQQGRAALERFYRTARGGMREASFGFDRFVDATDPDVLIVEGHGRAVTTAGRRYDNRYLWIFGFAPDGRVATLREYADPLVIVESFPPPPTQGAAA